MTANSVNGSENGARSGAQALGLLAAPLNAPLLRALAEGDTTQTDLRKAVGAPPQTTLRAQLKRLADTGAIEKRRRDRFPGTLEYGLTVPGQDLLAVLDLLVSWLGLSPQGPLVLPDNAARAAVKAMSAGWSAAILRVLASGSYPLTELDRVISTLSYPAIERRLGAMRLAGQVKACRPKGRSTPHTVTPWLRRGMGPMAAAIRWERHHHPLDTAPMGALEVETIFLLSAPLIALPGDASGRCRLAVEMPTANGLRLAGVGIDIQAGKAAECSTTLSLEVDASAVGNPSAWLDALVDGRRNGLDLGGSTRLAGRAIDGLHSALTDTSPLTEPLRSVIMD